MKFNTKLVLPAILLTLMTFGMAEAQQIATVSLGSTTLDTATTNVCKVLKDLQGSNFVKLIALVMFVAGMVMMWLKIRGGMALSITAFVGYALITQSLAIANAFGLLPKTSGCTT